MQDIGVGLIGCGNISGIYLTNIPMAPGLKVRAVADLRPEVADAQGEKFGVEAMPIDALLARDDIGIVVNLTVPNAHSAVSLAALSAGKHVFSEKPLATDVELGRKVVAEAEARGLLVGCAPDTFLGAGSRTARKLIDAGTIGRVVAGVSLRRCRTAWSTGTRTRNSSSSPAPARCSTSAPYYITTLVNLLGPVARVRSVTSTGFPERVVTAEGPRRGQSIMVETPTTVLSLLEFVAGAQIIFGASWDVWRHSLPTDRALRHRRDAARARSQLLQRRGGNHGEKRGMDAPRNRVDAARRAQLAGRSTACRQLPGARRLGDGGRLARRAAAAGERPAGAARAGGDGRHPQGGGGRSRHPHLARRKAGAAQRRRGGAAVPRVNFGWTAARAGRAAGSAPVYRFMQTTVALAAPSL